MSPLQIKLAIYALIAVIITGTYFSWKYHVESVQKEKDKAEVALRDAKTAEDGAKLMAEEKAKVEFESKQQNERLQNAVTIYAQRANDLNDDVANLTKRMRNSNTAASCSKNPLPGTSDDHSEGKGRDNETNSDIASAAIKLANLCEKKINELPVQK